MRRVFLRVLLDDDDFLVTVSLLGIMRITRKHRNLTVKATRQEHLHFLNVCNCLKRAGVPIEPGSYAFELQLESFAEAVLSRGGHRWSAYFHTAPEELASSSIHDDESES